jgi:DNA primase
MSINLDLNVFKCWICDYSSRGVHRLVRRFADYNTRKEWEKLDGTIDLSATNLLDNLFAEEEEEVLNEEIEMPTNFYTLTSRGHKLTGGRPRKYLKDRNLTGEDILRWKIGYCDAGDFAGRVIIPSFNDKGELNYYIARTYENNWMKYKNPPASKDIIFNELYIDWGSDLIIVEGVFDAIVAGNAVPLLGSTLRENSKLFKRIVENDTPIYLALDDDAKSKELRIIKKLLTFDLEVYKIDTSGFEDVGSMPKDTFLSRKSNSTLMTPDEILLGEALSL